MIMEFEMGKVVTTMRFASKPNDQLVSIIVPAYNAADSLERCVRSALEQTYENIEVILVDDGSIDKTPDMAEYLGSIDNRIKVIHQSNRGLSGARNTGLDAACGELVFFLDSDDYIEPGEIECLCTELKQTNADLVVGGMVLESSAGIRGRTIAAEAAILDEESYWSRAHRAAAGDYIEYVVSWGKLFKREVFLNERFDDGKLHEDEYIIHRLIAKCKTIAVVETTGYVYVQNSKSIMHNPNAKSLLDGAEALILRAKYYIDRGWADPAWEAVLFSREYLAASANLGTGEEIKSAYESLLSLWKENYRRLKALDKGTFRHKVTCRVFLIAPKLFSRLVSRRKEVE